MLVSGKERKLMEEDLILKAENISEVFPVKGFLGKKGEVRAVDGVSLDIHKGENYGLVGESGCGKSTLGRCLLRLIEPTSGEIYFKGENLREKKGESLRKMRQKMQMVFQDPYLSLDPKKRVGYTLMEALKIHGLGTEDERFSAALEMMKKVGFREEHFFRYPHEFSGGQRQRIGLARALILNPELIVCDEPVSALDVSVQAQIINLMEDIQKETKVSYLFITHNMSVVKHISHRIGVMYLGHLVEEGTTEDIFGGAAHPYTQALLSAVSSPDPHNKKKHIVLKGEVPSPLHVPKGCVFSTRCPYCRAECLEKRPELKCNCREVPRHIKRPVFSLSWKKEHSRR
jgi:peptide/nickel transport system ATP-binding protein/oligopeptide transport system ATP-binding protein